MQTQKMRGSSGQKNGGKKFEVADQYSKPTLGVSWSRPLQKEVYEVLGFNCTSVENEVKQGD